MAKREHLPGDEQDEGSEGEVAESNVRDEVDSEEDDNANATNTQRKRARLMSKAADSKLQESERQLNLEQTGGEWGEEELNLDAGEDIDALQGTLGAKVTPFNMDEEADAGLVDSYEKRGTFHDEVDNDPWLQQLDDGEGAKKGKSATVVKKGGEGAVYASKKEAMASLLSVLPEGVTVTAFISKFRGGEKKFLKKNKRKKEVEKTAEEVARDKQGEATLKVASAASAYLMSEDVEDIFFLTARQIRGLMDEEEG